MLKMPQFIKYLSCILIVLYFKIALGLFFLLVQYEVFQISKLGLQLYCFNWNLGLFYSQDMLFQQTLNGQRKLSMAKEV